MRGLRRFLAVVVLLALVWAAVRTGVIPLPAGMLPASGGSLGLPAACSRLWSGIAGIAASTGAASADGSASAGSATGQTGDGGFSYSCLGISQQDVYEQLLAGCSARQASFTIQCRDTGDIEPALQALLEDHPELFWLDGAATYQSASLIGGQVTVTPSTNVGLDQVDGIQRQIDAEANAWLASLPAGASDYDKVRSAYEWVIQNTDYDPSSSQNQNIQSVFVGHASVCAGYAKAFQYLLQKAGVWCAYVTGQIDEGAHAWDLVRIDGTYTYCDPTWGDPTYFTSQGQTVEGNITYDYLCLTTQEMERDHHAADRASQLPTCDSTAYDWYRLNGTYLTSLDSQAISDAFWAQVRAGQGEVGFKFADDATYQQAASLLASNGFLQNSLSEYGRQRGLSQVSYSYTTEPELRIVRVFW